MSMESKPSQELGRKIITMKKLDSSDAVAGEAVDWSITLIAETPTVYGWVAEENPAAIIRPCSHCLQRGEHGKA